MIQGEAQRWMMGLSLDKISSKVLKARKALSLSAASCASHGEKSCTSLMSASFFIDPPPFAQPADRLLIKRTKCRGQREIPLDLGLAVVSFIALFAFDEKAVHMPFHMGEHMH